MAQLEFQKEKKTKQHISSDLNTPTTFQKYDRNAIKQDPITDYINGWQINYLAFAEEATQGEPPIIILGGAFQNFISYKYCLPPLLQSAPVILLDLPATGGNTQTHNTHLNMSAKDISMVELAVLLSQWLESVQLAKVSVMGMSLGSVIAANFAHANPTKMHHLVLMGVMQHTRKSWRMLIEESLLELDKQNMNDFGEAVVLYLVNHAKLDKTGMSNLVHNLFHNQMASFTYNEKLRYRINAHRLLNVTEVPLPTCSTLVATGQYDSFTLPHENANFALGCHDSTYVIIKNADHVPQLQKRKETLALFSTFLAGKSLDELDGIDIISKENIPNIERRSEERLLFNTMHTLRHNHGKRTDNVVLVDMSFYGVLFSSETIEQASFIFAENRDMLLVLEDEEGKFEIGLLLFEQKIRDIRALFKHGSFAKAERLKQYITNHKALTKLDLVAVS